MTTNNDAPVVFFSKIKEIVTNYNFHSFQTLIPLLVSDFANHLFSVPYFFVTFEKISSRFAYPMATIKIAPVVFLAKIKEISKNYNFHYFQKLIALLVSDHANHLFSVPYFFLTFEKILSRFAYPMAILWTIISL